MTTDTPMNAVPHAFLALDASHPAINVSAVTRADADPLLHLSREHAAQARLERSAYGPAREDDLEFLEALFEPPLRAWAWLARVDGQAVGYAGATVGFSLLERGYSFHLDTLYVRPEHAGLDLDLALFGQAQAMASRLGCLNLQWQAPVWTAAARRWNRQAARSEVARFVMPLAAAD